MRLWHISPGTKLQSFNLFVNGYVEHPYGLPGLDCPGCDKWATLNNLSIECPLEIRKEVEAAHQHQPCMPVKDFQRYTARWEAVLQRYGINVRLQPGCNFWPTVWQIPSRPKYQFFWPFCEIIVTEAISQLIRKHRIKGVALAEATVRSCGTLDPDEPIPEKIMRRMEDEMDLLELCPQVKNPKIYGSFYSMLPVSDTYNILFEDPARKHTVCTVCGHRYFSDTAEHEIQHEAEAFRRHRVLPSKYTYPVDVFQSHVYFDGIVISERFFTLLSESDLKNCIVHHVTVVDEASLANRSRASSDVAMPTKLDGMSVASTLNCENVPELNGNINELFKEEPCEIVEESGDVTTSKAPAEDFSPLCFVGATADVGEAHKPVRWMVRSVPDVVGEHYGLGETQISGWVFLTGEEEDEEGGQIGMYYLKDIIESDPAIVPYLKASPPCRLKRDDNLPIFYHVSEDA